MFPVSGRWPMTSSARRRGDLPGPAGDWVGGSLSNPRYSRGRWVCEETNFREAGMPEIVRAALVQQAWTGDKDSMIAAAVAHIGDRGVGRGAGRLPAGAVLRAVLLPGAGRRLLLLHRGDPRRADDQAAAGRRPAAPHRDHRADVRGRAAGPVLQHRGGHRRGRHVPREVPEESPAAGQGVLGEVLLPPGQPRLPGVRHRRRPDRRLHLLRPALPRGLAGARPGRREDRLQPVGHQPRAVVVPVAA